MICDVCKHSMKVVGKVNSGNSVYETYQCSYCSNRKTKCNGSG